MCDNCDHTNPKQLPLPNIDWSKYLDTEAGRWLASLPEYVCACGNKSIFKECLDCQEKEDENV